MGPSSTSAAASRRIPNEILLAIITQSSPSTLAAFAQTSFACLEIASPLLYTTVTLEHARQAAQFFHPPRIFPALLPHLEPYTSRTQTKHLATIMLTYDDQAAKQHPFFTPPTGPLLLDFYTNPVNRDCLQKHVNPSLYLVQSVWPLPTVLGQVSARRLTFFSRVPSNWDRLEDLVFPGYFPDSIPSDWGKEGKDYRFTLDLSMIEQRMDPRNPKGSCQRLLEEFGRKMKGSRGRVWVGSREMREMFEVGKEEVVERLKGEMLGKEVERITVEISKIPLL